MTDLQIHPVADLFPMLPDDELAELAADIKERGQLQPIILDAEGRILDGRNRYAACAMAGVEPRFEAYSGDDPNGYALAVNVARRSLRPSQKYMIKEMARRLAVVNGSHATKTVISRNQGESDGLSQAATVLDHAPDLARQVVAGNLPLHKAVEEARQAKKLAQEQEDKRRRLAEDAPDLLALFQDDQLSLDEAVSVLEQRLEKARQEAEQRRHEEEGRLAEEARLEGERKAAEQRERRTATLLLCKLIPALAEMDGEQLASLYDPDQEPPEFQVTSETLMRAGEALDGIMKVWQERELS